MMVMMMMMMNCFCGMVDQRKAEPYFQPGLLSEIVTIANLRHATSRVWTCAESEFRLWWMKLYSSDNHYTTASPTTLLYLRKIRWYWKVVSWKSTGLSAEQLTTRTAINNTLSPSIKWYQNSIFCFIFRGSCLKEKNGTFTSPNVIIILFFQIRCMITRFSFCFYFKEFLTWRCLIS